jgi:hypothetical protein
VLYNLHYMDQIDDLGTHPELVNWNRGSTSYIRLD